MIRFTISQLLLVVTWCAIAFVCLNRYFTDRPYSGMTRDLSNTMIFHSSLDGDVITQFNLDDVATTPLWHAADLNPPLDARTALVIADRYQREHLLDSDQHGDWGLDSLTLHPLDAATGKWCWSVLYSQYPQYKFSGLPAEHSFYILMDGRVVAPEPYRSEHLHERSEYHESGDP